MARMRRGTVLGLRTESSLLVVNPFGIGDVLFATPLIRRLRERFPASLIGFVCNSRVAPLLAGNKNLNEVFVFDKGDYRALWKKDRLSCLRQFLAFLKRIKSRKFDIALDLSLGHQYSFFLMLLGVPVRIGYNFKGRGRFLTHKININGYNDKHIVEYYLDIYKEIIFPLTLYPSPQRGEGRAEGVRDDGNLEIFIPEDDLAWADTFLKNNGIKQDERFLAVMPGGGASWGINAAYKQWPARNFAEAVDELMKNYGFKAVIMGGPDDLDVCKNVLKALKREAVFACGKTTLPRFAALLKKAGLALCNDGGPLHIAVAVGTKTVSVFGPVDEKVYGPYPPDEKHIVVKAGIDCRPCYKGFKLKECENRRCLLDIRPQDVIEAATKLLDSEQIGEM